MIIGKEIERLRRCCDRRGANWKALPVEGASLVSCYIESSGKRGSMVLLTREYPPLHVPLDHSVVFRSLEGVEQRFLSLDDSSVGLILDPSPATEVRVVEAKVDFWLTDEDPAVHLAVPRSGERWELGAAFSVALRFGVARTE